jgi:fluoride exporter
MHYSLRDCIFVAMGGMLGALARYGAGVAAGRVLGKGFPWGTLIVNVLGCFLMGIVLRVILKLESDSSASVFPAIRSQLAFWHKGIAIGFLGGLTTFSSFGADTLRELEAGQPASALTNVVANVALSLLAVFLGSALIQAVD